VQAYQDLVLALGQTLGFRSADLDDTAADVFAEVWLALPGFEGRSSLGTWIYRIAIRVFIRRRRSAPTVTGLSHEIADDPQPPPSQRLEAEESRQRLWHAVAQLDPRSAAAVELYYRQGWPLAQIAEALECPQGTVKTLLFRARASLREALSSQEVLP
jgi:RNA polymerase sigma-70 factor (ECF subfamily)